MEPHNQKDRCDVCVRKDGEVVGHIEKGRSGRFSKTMFFLGDKKGLKIPCKLTIIGHNQWIDILIKGEKSHKKWPKKVSFEGEF